MKSYTKIYAIALSIATIITACHLHACQDRASATLEQIRQDIKSATYVQKTLPHNLSHLRDLLAYSNHAEQKRDYTQSVFRLFCNLLKGAEYLNERALRDITQALPTLLANQCTPQTAKELVPDMNLFESDASAYFRQAIDKTLYRRFSTSFDQFRSEPGKFMSGTSSLAVCGVHWLASSVGSAWVMSRSARSLRYSAPLSRLQNRRKTDWV